MANIPISLNQYAENVYHTLKILTLFKKYIHGLGEIYLYFFYNPAN